MTTDFPRSQFRLTEISTYPVIASEAKQSRTEVGFWIASSPFGLLAMTSHWSSRVEPLEPLQFGKRLIGRAPALLGRRFEHLIDLSAVEHDDRVLAAFVAAFEIARVVAQAHGVTVVVAERLDRRLGDESAADVGRIGELG